MAQSPPTGFHVECKNLNFFLNFPRKKKNCQFGFPLLCGGHSELAEPNSSARIAEKKTICLPSSCYCQRCWRRLRAAAAAASCSQISRKAIKSDLFSLCLVQQKRLALELVAKRQIALIPLPKKSVARHCSTRCFRKSNLLGI
jgi:hypothetical protein